MTTPNKILLVGGIDPRRVSHPCNAANNVYPGTLCQLMSTGKVQPHSVAGGHAEKLFALENVFTGFGLGTTATSSDLTTAWPINQEVQMVIARPGDVVLARLATGQNVAIGDKLISAGTGSLTADGADSTHVAAGVIGTVLEACNNSGGTTPFVKIRVQ